jgi:probable F420-dependent oxidoreductase
MKTGITVRNMGPQSTPEMMRDCVLLAEQAGLESAWITDHIAIPPDDAEGSGGRYADPLTTLSWLAGMSTSIMLGVGVLVVPYRPPIPTIKQIATLQELSGERLLLGLAVGWMDAEFRALGIDRRQRGRITDEMLGLFNDYFSREVITVNDQSFICSPRPVRPPVYIGGAAPHALKRAIRFDHGWLPMARDLDRLANDIETFHGMAKTSGKAAGPVTVMTGLPLKDEVLVREQLDRLRELGVERVICGVRYHTLAEFEEQLNMLNAVSRP